MGRAPCCDKDGLKKGPWLPEEDQKLLDYIEKHGPGNWRTLPKKAGLERCGKSCRLRWTNYLRPDIKRGRFSFEEEEAIIQLHSMLGNKWSAIAAKLPGRTDNEIKNYWNTHIRKRLLRMGIDPVTHTRRLDFLDLPSILKNASNNTTSDHHPHHQLNLLKLLSLHSLVNPNYLLNLASLLQNQNLNQNQNQNILEDHQQLLGNNNNSNPSHIMQNQFLNNTTAPVQNDTTFQTCATSGNNVIFEDDAHQMMLNSGSAQAHYQHPAYAPDLSSSDHHQNFATPHHQDSPLLNNEQCKNTSTSVMFGSEIANIQSSGDYRAMMDSLLDTLENNNNYYTNNLQLEQDLRMPSLLSTPSTSQQTPPLSASNSAAYQANNSSSTATTTTSSEDEIDSYCQNLMNFDDIINPFDLFVNNL